MEHACYRCGELVGDAIPFCLACGAPQIRVTPREPQLGGAQERTVQADVPPPPPPPGQITKTSGLFYRVPIRWKTFFRLALPLAAVVGFLMSIQSGLGPLVLLPGGVVLAIHYYRGRQPSLLTSWTGAKLGMSVGLLSFVFFALFFAVESATNVPAYREAMTKLAEEALARQPTLEAQQLAQAWFTGPHGIAVITAMFLASTLFFLLVISGVTGALAGAFSRSPRVR